MKEYIEKQELMNLQTYEFGVSMCNTTEYVKVEDISDLPTVAQSDLESLAYNRGARAFARKFEDEIERMNFLPGEILGFEKIMGDLLKEMGCNNE
ncbi:MAG: hypothetical protein UHU19_07150 [Lachnospiraceae bacterium]|nr:hypothetical protein [Lachnospiraceae bacterium]